jgi:hypothetical protein
MLKRLGVKNVDFNRLFIIMKHFAYYVEMVQMIKKK